MRRHPLIWAVLVVLGAATLLAACDDNPAPQTTDPGQASQTPQPDREYDLDETGRAAAELLGGDGAAAYAILKAFDSGYSPYQVAYAIDAGLIDESGGVEGVTPAWPSGSTLSSNHDIRFPVASVGVGGSLPAIFAETGDDLSDRSDFEQVFQEINDQGQSGRWLVWVLGATGTGYSVGQITAYLDENKPFTDLSPPTAFGVPIVIDSEGSTVEPELPTDWAYKGRNLLADLQEDEDLDFDDNVTVLVIGMVNAGYSPEQIQEAWRTKSIGLCSTQGASSDADAAFSPCYVENGAIVSPAETTPFSPARIAIEDVLPKWPPKNTASLTANLDGISKLESGEEVSLKLTPYLPNPSTTVKITSHNVVMEIQPAGGESSWYNVTGSWRIELIETETDLSENRSHDKGDSHVLEGEFYSNQPTPLDNLKLATEYMWTAYTPAGKIKGKYGDITERSFTGSLDEDLEGDGSFGSIGPAQVNWDTFPGVE